MRLIDADNLKTLVTADLLTASLPPMTWIGLRRS